jgi:hypothetical protein
MFPKWEKKSKYEVNIKEMKIKNYLFVKIKVVWGG